MRVSRSEEARRAEALSLLLPLHFFYEQRGRPLPRLEIVRREDLPDAEHALLVHDHDMTSTLGHYHDSALTLSVIEKEATGDYLLRMVVLNRERAPQVPVEFGAIGIALAHFPPGVRRMIVRGERPLGAVLVEENVAFRSEPQAFFKIEADELIGELLAEAPGTELWGRCNVLSTPQGDTLADIVEILPRALAPVPAALQPPQRRQRIVE
jgi:chorismate-pyruvate lyase